MWETADRRRGHNFQVGFFSLFFLSADALTLTRESDDGITWGFWSNHWMPGPVDNSGLWSPNIKLLYSLETPTWDTTQVLSGTSSCPLIFRPPMWDDTFSRTISLASFFLTSTVIFPSVTFTGGSPTDTVSMSTSDIFDTMLTTFFETCLAADCNRFLIKLKNTWTATAGKYCD